MIKLHYSIKEISVHQILTLCGTVYSMKINHEHSSILWKRGTMPNSIMTIAAEMSEWPAVVTVEACANCVSKQSLMELDETKL